MKKSLSILIMILLNVFCYSWSDSGHEIIARIARDHLDKKILSKIEALLPEGMNFIQAAVWADKIRYKRKETKEWHYVNLPARQNVTLDNMAGYYDENSIIFQMEKEIGELENKKTPFRKKQEDLLFLIHFTGDIHMPLHCIDDNDNGGNLKIIHTRGKKYSKKTNLHHYWDEILSAYPMTQSDIDSLAAKLSYSVKPGDFKKYSGGGPKQWAYESYLTAKKFIYEDLPEGPAEFNLPGGYSKKMRNIAEEQLKKAGIRLALILEEIFR